MKKSIANNYFASIFLFLEIFLLHLVFLTLDVNANCKIDKSSCSSSCSSSSESAETKCCSAEIVSREPTIGSTNSEQTTKSKQTNSVKSSTPKYPIIKPRKRRNAIVLCI